MALLKELHQLSESANSVRADVVKKLKGAGYKLHSQEQSPGALKAWLNNPGGAKFEDLVKVLPGAKLRKKSFGQQVIEGPGYEVELQGEGSVYVAVYRKGQAGDEYSMGMDT